MKRFLIALVLSLLPSLALAQCNGVFPNNTACGNISGSSNLPRPVNVNSFPANAPGGVTGQIQINAGSSLFGGLNQVSAAKTADYPVVAADLNTTVVFGTGSTAQHTITLPSLPSTGFFAGGIVCVKNADVYSGIGTGHAATLSGFPTDLSNFLWPQQTACAQVNAAASGWLTVQNPGRWIIPTTAEICWTQNGNDANDGLGAGTNCMAHVQTALTVIGQQWDGTGYNGCAIGIYAGGTNTLSESVSQTGQSIGCFITVNMRGAVTWTNTAMCWTAGDGSIAVFNFNLGFTPTLACNTGNTAATGQWYCHQYCIYDINGSWEWNPGGNNDDMVFIDAPQGRVTIGLSGGGLVIGPGTAVSAHSVINCNSGCSGGQISGAVGFSPGPVTLGQTFIDQNGGYINTTASWTLSTAVVSASSIARGNSRLIVNGTTVPGGINTASGGQTCTTLAC